MNIVIYGKPNCQFCDMAKNYLDSRSLPYEYRQLDVDFVREDLMALAPNARSYPQIFIDGRNIGGFNELSRWLIEGGAAGGNETAQFLTE